jgi:hypothetical protein
VSLGRFLEVALPCADIRASWDYFQSLAFGAAVTGDVWSHPYGVVTCEGLSLGLHGAHCNGLTLCFVRQDVAALHRELIKGSIDVESAQLSNDVFNQLQLRDPDGNALRILEARTFSPPLEVPQVTAMGRFLCVSLPSTDLTSTAHFWAGLGIATTVGEDPWSGLSLLGTAPVTYHLRSHHADPILLFRAGSAETQHPPGPYASPDGQAIVVLA